MAPDRRGEDQSTPIRVSACHGVQSADQKVMTKASSPGASARRAAVSAVVSMLTWRSAWVVPQCCHSQARAAVQHDGRHRHQSMQIERAGRAQSMVPKSLD